MGVFWFWDRLLMVAVLSTVLAGCGSERPRSAAALSENQEPATPSSSTPLASTAETLTVPSQQPASVAAAGVRQYPSLPDAVTEMPPWNDTKPPFDLAEFIEAPPAEENAAPLYLDALCEFDTYIKDVVFPESSVEEQKRRSGIFRERFKEQDRLEEAWEKDPKSVDMAAVDAWLADYDVGFQKLAAAQQRPRCVFQTGLRVDSLLAHAQTVRQVARVALWRTRRDLERGDLEQPIQDLMTVLRLSRDLRPRGEGVCQMVSIAVDGISCRQIVPLILAAPGIETHHCSRLLALLARHEAEAIDPFREAVRADYFINRFFLHDLQHRTGTFDPTHMKEDFDIKGNVNSWVACIRFVDALGGIGPTGEEKFKALMSDSLPSGGAETKGHALLPSAWTGGKMLAADDYVKEVDVLNRVYASILDLADQPNLPQQDFDNHTMTRLCEPLWKTTLTVFAPISAFVSLRNAVLREEATLRGTQCLVALRRWQLEHTELPKDLETLVKAAGMPGVPIDPYSGQPLRMAVVWASPIVYSVGHDGKDDKAQVESEGGQMPGDLIFRLAAPPASVRKWTDNSGRHSIEAELIEVKAGNVVLRKASGKTTTLPLDKLSQADRDHLESLRENSEDRP